MPVNPGKHAQGRALTQVVSVHTSALCSGQIVNSPPAHLQKQERHNEHIKCRSHIIGARTAEMHLTQISKPGNGSPSFLWVPGPIMPPSLFSPERPHEHAQRHKRQTHIHKVIGDIHFVGSARRFLDEEQINSHHRGSAQQGIGKHIHNNVGCEPWTLQGRHQRFIVYFGLQHVDHYKHRGQDGAERQYPLIAPTQINHQSGKGQEERIPQARFAHGAQRWPFE